MTLTNLLKNVRNYERNRNYDLVEDYLRVLYDYVDLEIIKEKVDFDKVEELREINNMLKNCRKLELMDTKRSIDYVEESYKLFKLFNTVVDELIV